MVETTVRDFQLRNHRQSQKRKGKERVEEDVLENAAGRLMKLFQIRTDPFQRFTGHEPCDIQFQLRQDFSVLDHDDSASDFFYSLHRQDQVPVIHAQGHQIMRVMGDGCRHSASLHMETFDDAFPKTALFSMSFYDKEFCQVRCGIWDEIPIRFMAHGEIIGEKAVGYDFNEMENAGG